MLYQTSRPPCRQPRRPQRRMRIGDARFAEMKDRGGEDGAGVAFGYAFDQMLQIADAAAGEHHRLELADRAVGKNH